MKCYDEELRRLSEQCARRKRLGALAWELEEQCRTYSARAQELKECLEKEQADVDRLEEGSLSAFFYNVMGKMDEKKAKEESELYAARLKYQNAVRELEQARSELECCRKELDTLLGCEERYANLFREKTAAIKKAGGASAEKILRLEERGAYLQNQKRELQEAISAGQIALECTDRILESLGSAEGWGTWDLFGGGFIADMAKHSHLDDAQAMVEELQTQLRRFRTELADVTISADFQISIDGFLRVADYLFDGIFADWAVLDKINRSQEQVYNTRNQICTVLDQLEQMKKQAEQEESEIQTEIKSLVGSVPM